MVSAKPSCRRCRFVSGSGENLECRRYPPIVAHPEADIQHQYPSVLKVDWCGEFEPKKPASVSEAAKTLARHVIVGDAEAAYALIDKLQEERK